MPGPIVHQEFDPTKGILSYYTYDVLTRLLRDLVESHPRLAQLDSIGKSLEGRDLWLITLTNQATGPALEKPAYWIDANTHASEVTGSTVALYTIWSYLTNYGVDETITRVLDRSAIYILPRLSVDGAEKCLTTPYYLRSSTRPYPYDEERDGLYEEDIDGDGWPFLSVGVILISARFSILRDHWAFFWLQSKSCARAYCISAK